MAMNFVDRRLIGTVADKSTSPIILVSATFEKVRVTSST